MLTEDQIKDILNDTETYELLLRIPNITEKLKTCVLTPTQLQALNNVLGVFLLALEEMLIPKKQVEESKETPAIAQPQFDIIMLHLQNLLNPVMTSAQCIAELTKITTTEDPEKTIRNNFSQLRRLIDPASTLDRRSLVILGNGDQTVMDKAICTLVLAALDGFNQQLQKKIDSTTTLENVIVRRRAVEAKREIIKSDASLYSTSPRETIERIILVITSPINENDEPLMLSIEKKVFDQIFSTIDASALDQTVKHLLTSIFRHKLTIIKLISLTDAIQNISLALQGPSIMAVFRSNQSTEQKKQQIQEMRDSFLAEKQPKFTQLCDLTQGDCLMYPHATIPYLEFTQAQLASHSRDDLANIVKENLPELNDTYIEQLQAIHQALSLNIADWIERRRAFDTAVSEGRVKLTNFIRTLYHLIGRAEAHCLTTQLEYHPRSSSPITPPPIMPLLGANPFSFQTNKKAYYIYYGINTMKQSTIDGLPVIESCRDQTHYPWVHMENNFIPAPIDTDELFRMALLSDEMSLLQNSFAAIDNNGASQPITTASAAQNPSSPGTSTSRTMRRLQDEGESHNDHFTQQATPQQTTSQQKDTINNNSTTIPTTRDAPEKELPQSNLGLR